MVLSRTIGGGTCVTKGLSLIVFAEPGDQQPVPNTKENEETSTVKKEVEEKDQGADCHLSPLPFSGHVPLIIFMCFLVGLCFRIP